jgi:hypothetical protein
MKLKFKDQGGTTVLFVSVIGKEDSEGWLKAMVHFEDSGLSAIFKISLMLNDLYSFTDQLKYLQKSLKGSAVFSNIEDNVTLKLSTDELGHIAINGKLRHPYKADLELLFVINSDQTFLPDLITECTKIIEHYNPK